MSTSSGLDKSKGKAKEKQKNGAPRFEVIPEHALFETAPSKSFRDESPNDDDDVRLVEQEEVSQLKRQRENNDNSMETNESVAQPTKQDVENNDTPYQKKTRKRTAACWQYLEDVEIDGKSYVKCKFCGKTLLCTDTSSTTTFNRHVDKCLAKHGQSMQTKLAVQRGVNKDEVSLSTFKYDHALVREVLSHYIMVNELPFMHVESFMFNKLMSTAAPQWKKVTRGTLKSDCKTTYEIEKKKLVKKFQLVKRINITTDMWTSNQKIGYMVITSHWIDDDWKLNSRILNFCNVPPPHSGYVIAEAIHKCLADWDIMDKIGTITVDNARANDVALRNLRESFSIRKCLPIGGKLFHVRCCAHILNLCVQDGLKLIEPIINKIRDGVKYVAGSEGRRNKFSEISKHLKLKPKKLILDVPTRWNSTYDMLHCALNFRQVFPRYACSDSGFTDYVPTVEDWERVERVCDVLAVFEEATKIVSGSAYPTSNLFLSKIRRVKQVIDNKVSDPDMYISQMADAMKNKFDKYWKESNLMMSIGAVLDPRLKMDLPKFCFNILYPLEGEAEKKLSELSAVLHELYAEYVADDLVMNGSESRESSQISSSDKNKEQSKRETLAGLSEFESYMLSTGVNLQPVRTELDEYLTEKNFIFSETSQNFDALTWWKIHSAKYPILSRMARDMLAVPISTVASESAFSAGGRVIEPHRSCLKTETVEMLMCGADWTREIYGLKKFDQEKKKMKVTEIYLD